MFRGSSPGVEVGPYLSQFLLIGNTDLNGGGSVPEGRISYGVLQVDQKVPIAEPGAKLYGHDAVLRVCSTGHPASPGNFR